MRSGDNVSSEKSDWEAAVSGDPEAFARIFDRNRDRVFRHAYRLTGSVQDAEDVIAMVFLETWRSKSKVRVVDESVIGWLLAVANNVVRNQRRTYNRHRVAMSKLPVSEPMPDHAERVLDRIEADGANEQMRRAFTRLEQKERDVLLLCVVEEMTIRQAGAALRLPVGTVKSRLFRAKAKLTRLMSEPAPQ